MTSMTDYLSQYREEIPAWLKNYTEGDFVPFSDFMSGRVGYYPGSGFDGNLVSVANKAHCLHSYIHVDYGVTREQIMNCFHWNGSGGYNSIGTVEWTEQDLSPHGQHPMDTDYMPKGDPMKSARKDVKPFCFLEIFERVAFAREDLGAERFAVAFLFADGIATYHQLFCKEYCKAPWIVLLQDHGFGGNYNNFGKGGLLDAIMTRNGIWPELVLCATNTHIWDGYEEIPDVQPTFGGMHNEERHLFIKTANELPKSL